MLFTLTEIVDAFISIYNYIFFGGFVFIGFTQMIGPIPNIFHFSFYIYFGHQSIQYIEYLFLKDGR